MANLIIEGNGWLTPDGEFVRSEPAPPIHFPGMPHTGHSKAILEWIDTQHPDLVVEVEKLIPTDGDIIDVPRQTVIDLMVRHGFVRVVYEEETLWYEGEPNPIQITILKNSAMSRGQKVKESK